jgi:translation initiation factor 2B subunit (eIF-2B alpha/beta/delta family)
MDKIHDERKTAIANRNLIRTLDAVVKKCQNDMQQFVKTKKQSEEHHKTISDLANKCDHFESRLQL